MMLTPMILGLRDRLAGQARIVEQALALLADKEITVRVSETFSLGRAAEAHATLEAGGAIGKIVLTID